MKKILVLAVITTLLLNLTGCNKVEEQSETVEYKKEINKEEVMTFEINADESAWQDMLDNAINEEYISADITINGTTINNVGIRPKGNSSLTQVANDDTIDRYSFKIKFDEYVDGQTWMGLDKIVLNNMYSDATYLKEYLSYDIMTYIGVEAPLFAFADITVNGSTWGFYLAVEDVDSGYLDRVANGEGELYKPDNMDNEQGQLNEGNTMELPGDGQTMPTPGADGQGDGQTMPTPGADGQGDGQTMPTPGADSQGDGQTMIPPDFDENASGMKEGNGFGGGMSGMAENGVSLEYTDDEISSYSGIFDNAETKTDESDYQRVITALKNLNEGTDLDTYVDVEAVLKYFAAHTVVVNLDSYVSSMAHNYYLYEKDGQISIIPWDYNLSFGGFQSSDATSVVNFPIDTPVSGISIEERPLLSKLLEVPEYLEKYHTYIQEIVDGYFADGKFDEKIETLNTLISDYVKNDPTAFYTFDEYETAVNELKALGNLRAESINGQLEGSIPSTTQGQEEDSSSLIDASSIDLSAMGSQGGNKNGFENNQGGMGGNGRPGDGGNFNLPEGLSMETIRNAREMIGSQTFDNLTDEQLEELKALGLT
ncbi:MAG: CotH kinase family protein, partial [Anaerocolumna sp.]